MSEAIQKAREALETARDEIKGLCRLQCIDVDSAIMSEIGAALAATTPADVGEDPVAWQVLDYAGTWVEEDADMIDVRRSQGHAVRPLYSATALERVTRERDNLQARLTARAKSMLRLRDALAQVHDNIEDEGDRAYFGSTNDADTFREVWQDLDAWAWDDIMSDGKLTDVYAASREAHTRAESAEAKLAEARKVISGLLASPAISDGNHSEPAWADHETIEAERAARRFLEETK